MVEAFEDPYLWTGLALVAVLGLVYVFGRAGIAAWLDGEIAKIRNELEQAKKLRAEAEETLALYREKHREAVQEAEHIIAQANKDAERRREEAAQELQESLKRHEQQAAERLARAEADAIAELRAATVDLALQASHHILSEQLTAAAAEDYMNRALTALPERLAKKPAA